LPLALQELCKISAVQCVVAIKIRDLKNFKVAVDVAWKCCAMSAMRTPPMVL
jgi:hypothetical protein